MINLWLVFTLVCITADWIAIWKNRPALNYFTKPFTLLFLLFWFWSAAVPGWITSWFILGFFFSLIGDIFLLLSAGYFKFGLAVFLLAHISYLVGFTKGLTQLTFLFWIMAGALAVMYTLTMRHLIRSVWENPTHRKMTVPIILYAAVISSMFLFAAWTLFRSDWPAQASTLVASGALLFTFSDLYLAYDRFVQPKRNGRLMIRITYHLGQLALAAGVILYSKLAA